MITAKRFHVIKICGHWGVVDRNYPDQVQEFKHRSEARKRAAERNGAAPSEAKAAAGTLPPQMKAFLRCLGTLLRAPRNRFGKLEPDRATREAIHDYVYQWGKIPYAAAIDTLDKAQMILACMIGDDPIFSDETWGK